MSDPDFCDSLSRRAESVLILTDFDREGRKMNRQLKRLLERKGVRVEAGLRSQFSGLMAAIGVWVIEALDDARFRS